MKEQRKILVLARGNYWWAPLISSLSGTWWNHVFFLYEDEFWDDWLAVDILTTGPTLLTGKRALKRYKKVECYDVQPDIGQALRDSKEDIGSGYDWLGLFVSLFLLLLFKATGYKRFRPLHSIARYTCLEWIITVLKRANVNGTEKFTPIITPPEEFETFIAECSSVTKTETPKEIWQ